jgi:predicted MFS family arabinose efflux permease
MPTLAGFARLLLGRLSDQIGCGPSLVVAFTLQTIALLLLPVVQHTDRLDARWLTLLYGSAIGGSRILALAIKQAPAERRGRAMASFSVSFPLSNGARALC